MHTDASQAFLLQCTLNHENENENLTVPFLLPNQGCRPHLLGALVTTYLPRFFSDMVPLASAGLDQAITDHFVYGELLCGCISLRQQHPRE